MFRRMPLFPVWPFFLCLLVHILTAKIIDSEKMSTLNKLKMNGDQYKRVENLHLNMYASAMKALIGSVGRDTYRKLSPKRAAQMRECLDKVSDNDLQSGAQCIVNAWNSKFTRRINRMRPKQQEESPFKVAEDMGRKRLTSRLLKYQSRKERKKRSYTNLEEDPSNAKFKPTLMNEVPALRSKFGDDSLLSAGAKIFLNGVNTLRNRSKEQSTGSYLSLQKLQKLIEIKAETRRYRRSLADIVLERKGEHRRRASASEKLREMMPLNKDAPMMKNLFNLLDSFEKHNQNSNYRFLSPKFGSVLPDKREDMKEFISPNFFPLYRDKNAVLPVPEVLNDMGLSEKEQNAMMDLIVEASGANKLVEDTMQIFRTNETREINNEINQITQLMQSRMHEVNSSLSDAQQADMNRQDFAFLNRSQLQMLYGQKGLVNMEPFNFAEYEQWSRTDLKRGLMNAIRSIADGHPLSAAHFSPKRRRKRQTPPEVVGTVVVGEPTILAPFIFGPDILDVVILGPVILSPSMFSPEILSPYLLGPVILSPSIGDPLILTPYIWAVYVLSPYVLSPNILNPFVMSPLILSPHVLSPDIMSPNLLNAIVLNPYVLSPAILTESAFVFDILSPSAFSRRRRR